MLLIEIGEKKNAWLWNVNDWRWIKLSQRIRRLTTISQLLSRAMNQDGKSRKGVITIGYHNDT